MEKIGGNRFTRIPQSRKIQLEHGTSTPSPSCDIIDRAARSATSGIETKSLYGFYFFILLFCHPSGF